MTRKYSITNILANTVSMFTQIMICFRYKIESAHKANSYAHPQHDRVCISIEQVHGKRYTFAYMNTVHLTCIISIYTT